MNSKRDQLIAHLSRPAKNRQDGVLIADTINALDHKYALSDKIAKEPGTEAIIEQLIGRIEDAFGGLSELKGKRILDLACGSNTSKAPSFVFVNTPLGERRIQIPSIEGYTAQFEPWFCRILLELGAVPVGIDIGDLDGETFEHYHVDLGLEGALDFLPSHSFDAVQDRRLFGSPEFVAQFPDSADRLKVAKVIKDQEQRLLKRTGIIVHSDAKNLFE